MFSLNEIFTTKTALPDGCGITEVLPSPHLRQYIRCFWKYDGNAPSRSFRIIPDCCADIIIPLDGSPSVFVGVSDESFLSGQTGGVFGIRFYAWAVAPFLHISLVGLMGGSLPASEVMKGFDELQLRIIAEKDFGRQIDTAQMYLSKKFDGKTDSDIMNAIYYALKNDCRVTVTELAKSCALSNRTLERRFAEHIGVSPKSAVELLRYQLLWQDMIKGGFSAADSVFKFGYFDEAHLHNDFRKYHGIGLRAALAEYFELSRFYNTANRTSVII